MRLLMVLFVVCVLLWIHAEAFAKDVRQHGGYFSASVQSGVARIDDKSWNWRGEDWNSKTYAFAWQFQFEYGYLFGSKVCVGPVVSMTFGIPNFVSGALHVKTLIPVGRDDSIHMMIGFGGQWRPSYVDADFFDKSPINAIYVPVQIGYEHIFESNFILGIVLHGEVAFNHAVKYVNGYEEGHSNTAELGFLGLGLQLGYNF